MRAQTVSRMCRNFRLALSFCWEVPEQDELCHANAEYFQRHVLYIHVHCQTKKIFDVFGELSFNHLCKVTIDINIHHEKLEEKSNYN